MTREEKLVTMNRQTLKDIAERHGLKVKAKDSTDKIRKMILKFEGETAAPAPAQKKQLAARATSAHAERAKKVVEVATEIKPGRKPKKLIEYNGESKGLCEWARIAGIHPNLLYYRLNHGWTMEKAMEKKPKTVK